MTTVTPEYDIKSAQPPPGTVFPIGYGKSFSDWVKHLTVKSDSVVENNLLSLLPFYPQSDGKRTAQVINTYIDDKNYIHEFYIENTETPKQGADTFTRDLVLVHGYGASLGLFLYNFDDLSSVAGVRIHAIDLLGFGFSSRPSFPKFNLNTVEGVKQYEDWFIDAIEKWRIKRGLDKFVLVGHSFGGYLSCCYAMKYHNQENQLLDKLVLLSPVGVERNKYSLLRNIPNPWFNDDDIKRQNANDHEIPIQHEFDRPQIVQSRDPSRDSQSHDSGEDSVHPKYKDIDVSEDDEAGTRRKIINFLWTKHISPFSVLRATGPFRSKIISGWTSRRFRDLYESNRKHYEYVQDYCYRTFLNKGSGEFAITRVLTIGATPRLPLIDRIPQFLAAQALPSFWIYGDSDWMNVPAGEEMTVEINQLAKAKDLGKLASFKILANSGHHLYMDNPTQFKQELFQFIGYPDS